MLDEMPVDLELLEQERFGSGVTMHRYAIQDGRRAG
jgi:hypothetical protein